MNDIPPEILQQIKSRIQQDRTPAHGAGGAADGPATGPNIPQASGSMEDRIKALEAAIAELARFGLRLPDNHPREFDAEITGHGAGGDTYTWKELTNVGGAVVDYGTPGTDSRNCTDATDASAAIEINGATFIPTGTRVRMLEIKDGDDNRYQFCCTSAVFTITGPSGSATAVDFSPYSTSEGATIYNSFEPLDGSPGSLGGQVDSDGTVVGSSCVVKAIGHIKMPCTWRKADSKWYFAAPNSAFP